GRGGRGDTRRRERPAPGGEHELRDTLGAERTRADRLGEVAERNAAIRADDEGAVRWQPSGVLHALDHCPRAGDGDGETHPARPRTRAAFTPAKPDDVDTAVSAAWGRGSPWTRSSPAQAASSVARPTVGGTRPSASTWRQRVASTAPAAPSVWPSG